MEDSGSANFRLRFTTGPQVLLRINKRVHTQQSLSAIRSLVDYLDTNKHVGVVLAGAVELHVVERYPRGGQDIVGTSHTPFVSFFEFIESEGHYSGRSNDELKSVAYHFGRLQQALYKLPRRIKLDAINKASRDWWRPISLQSAFVAARQSYLSRVDNLTEAGFAHALMRTADPMIANSVAKQRRLPSVVCSDECQAAYVDFHPHNVLMKNNTCVLISDFESCVPSKTQDYALAFAVHRFTREWLRWNATSAGSPHKSDIRRAVTMFIDCYRDGGGGVSLGFLQRCGSLIRAVNTRKLLAVYGIMDSRKLDRSARTGDTYIMEIRKFIAYMQEADLYEEALLAR